MHSAYACVMGSQQGDALNQCLDFHTVHLRPAAEQLVKA